MRLSVIRKSAFAIPAIILAASSCRPDLPTGVSGSESEIALARQTASYSTTIIAPLTGDNETRANGVNDAGEVVGQSVGGSFHAFVTLGGAVTELAGTSAQAEAISNGTIRYVVGRSSFLPARWTIVGNAPGAPESLDAGGATSGAALGVNDAGAAVGYAGTSAAVWNAAGVLSLVSTPTGFTKGEGRGIDNAGNGAFVFTRPDAGWEGGFATGYLRLADGQLIHLPPLSGDVINYVNDVGPAGGNLVRVAGSSYSSNSISRAVRWTVDISTGAITTETRPEDSHALAVADGGATAGFTEGAPNSLKSTPFRWLAGTLQSLSVPKGAKHGKAWAISPNGLRVVGDALLLTGRRGILWTFPSP